MDNLSKPVKTWLLIATLMPLLFAMIWGTALVFGIVTTGAFMSPDGGATPPAYQTFLDGLIVPTILWGVGLFILYLIHLLKTDRVRQDQKALWGVILFLGGIIAMVVYWFMYVWPEPRPGGREGMEKA